MSESWKIDPTTKDYMNGPDGKPVIDKSLATPATVRLLGHRTKWLYKPDDSWGSDFYSIRKRNNTRTPKLMETTASRALQPLIDDGRALDVTVTTTQTSRYTQLMNTQILEAQGTETEVTVNPIGR